MLFLFDVISGDLQRSQDPEGSELHDIESAKAEAFSCARQQAAEELNSGRPFPVDWKVEVLDGKGILLSTVLFSALLNATPATARHPDPVHAFSDHYDRAKLIFTEIQKNTAEMRMTFEEICQKMQGLRRRLDNESGNA